MSKTFGPECCRIPNGKTRPWRIRRYVWVILTATGLAGVHPARAAPPQVQMPTDESLQPNATTGGPLDFLGGIYRSNYLLGDLWGVRSALSRYCITIAIQIVSHRD